MPISYEIVGKIVKLTVVGMAENADFSDTLAKIIKDPRFEERSKILIVTKGATLNVSELEAHEVAFFMKGFADVFNNQVAVVANDESSFKVAKMIESTCEKYGVNFKVFNDVNAAQIWIEKDLA